MTVRSLDAIIWKGIYLISEIKNLNLI